MSFKKNQLILRYNIAIIKYSLSRYNLYFSIIWFIIESWFDVTKNKYCLQVNIYIISSVDKNIRCVCIMRWYSIIISVMRICRANCQSHFQLYHILCIKYIKFPKDFSNINIAWCIVSGVSKKSIRRSSSYLSLSLHESSNIIQVSILINGEIKLQQNRYIAYK